MRVKKHRPLIQPVGPVCAVFGDMRVFLPDYLPENSVDCIVTDNPYELEFMGSFWDSAGIAYRKSTWEKCFRVLKPGGYLIAFGAPRTYHRIAVAIEDAGFEIRDSLHWVYGTGMPKSYNVSKAVDSFYGVPREVIGKRSKPTGPMPQLSPRKTKTVIPTGRGTDGYYNEESAETLTAPGTPEAAFWEGWGTALKPCHEPIILARKPLQGRTVAINVLNWGTGGLNIDACRINRAKGDVPGWHKSGAKGSKGFLQTDGSDS